MHMGDEAVGSFKPQMDMSQGANFGMVSVVVFSWGIGMSVYVWLPMICTLAHIKGMRVHDLGNHG